MTRCGPARRLAMLLILLLAIAAPVAAQTRLSSNATTVAPKRALSSTSPRITKNPVPPASSPADIGGVLQFPGTHRRIGAMVGGCLLTALTLIPSILLCMTPFARLLIVFHFLRQALGLQTTPSNQTLIGLSLILTFFLMQPVATRSIRIAFVPMQAARSPRMDAVTRAEDPDAPVHVALCAREGCGAVRRPGQGAASGIDQRRIDARLAAGLYSCRS